ncbi:hypothetical protein HYH96_06130 [Clostridium botulinum]|uniref:DUF3784 domain-containing protein n=4 Tax=Clostridium TaxID=1485 RepID=A0AAE5C9P5_CLOSG|nr:MULTISPECIES: hypothetical protein [Clostridium]MBE6076688.1 hypothetical protein [Clostridium lundense]APH19776.1 putative membrane protein [Clostridium botulinum]AUM90870.1 hypothetical protein RSJ5_06180 [Clostridium botulinum]EDU37651.1 hypothetical protein CLOSPO_03820 [Clostridium sporogenes ATCC 15579]KEI78160.1 hypothetical protein N452_05930 [Clostridium botulinum A2 117]
MLRLIYITVYGGMCLFMLYCAYSSIVKKKIKIYVGEHRKITDKEKLSKALGINYLFLSICFFIYAVLLFLNKTPKYPIFTMAFIVLFMTPFILVNKYTKN